MTNRSLAYALALLTSTLALNGPLQADTVVPSWITEIDNPEALGDFNQYTLLSLTFGGATTHFRVENNGSEADNLRLRHSFDFIVCDGSVRVASGLDVQCDGSVMPQGYLQLAMSATFNPSITMNGVYWDTSLNGNSNFGLVAGTGLSLTAGTLMEGVFEFGSVTVDRMATQELEIQNPENPDAITVRDLAWLGVDREFYLIGQVDGDIIHTSARPPHPDADPILQGTSRDFTPDTPSLPYTCTFCTMFYTGLGFASPGRGGDTGVTDPVTGELIQIYGTRTQFTVTFRVREPTPTAPIPLPAAGWLLLGGLGALGLAARRRRA